MSCSSKKDPRMVLTEQIGEISHVPVAGAIVNAINDAMDADFE